MYKVLLILTKIVGVGLKDSRLLLAGFFSFGCFAFLLPGVLSRLDRNGSRRGVVDGVVVLEAAGEVVREADRLGTSNTTEL